MYCFFQDRGPYPSQPLVEIHIYKTATILRVTKDNKLYSRKKSEWGWTKLQSLTNQQLITTLENFAQLLDQNEAALHKGKELIGAKARRKKTRLLLAA